ncbi:hypothetical protein SAMN05421663_10582 [Terribacillus halophilus]|uniref:Uncharacterized protein n=1 Tax=Terribacillus halophilus TaxID=361279 RepID=A0A1G6QH72_9BACI|nr:hypothetical protein [Terribacillus halophilus]SDC91739.1 hypothetical protein SAMN05421663_10582 [Terribacillus halophilus]
MTEKVTEIKSKVWKHLLPAEDFNHLRSSLKKVAEPIWEEDEKFYKLVNQVIVGEDQKGKIMEAMKEETDRRKNLDAELTADTTKRINQIVYNLNDQVYELYFQQIFVTYSNKEFLERTSLLR